jgi:hypothetical protein
MMYTGTYCNNLERKVCFESTHFFFMEQWVYDRHQPTNTIVNED